MTMWNKKELTEMKEWVVVEGATPHYFETFEEAVYSPIKGHLMSKFYYEYHYGEK